MKSSADIKRRIKSVANTAQITKAMEVVSATKMRKSQESALGSRAYASAAFELLASVSRKQEKVQLPVLFGGARKTKSSGKNLLLVVASDKGLAGSLNSNVLRKAQAFLSANQGYEIAVVGKKASAFFTHRKIDIKKVFTGHGDYVDFDEVREMTEYVVSSFISGEYDVVKVIYTNFLSTLKQEAVVREILPLTEKALKEMAAGIVPVKGRYSGLTTNDLRQTTQNEYLFEPSPEKVLEALAKRLFQMQLYHITLEANASEHSARMVAMKTASENAQEIVSDLTLLFNKQRQSKITQEIVEITSGATAQNS